MLLAISSGMLGALIGRAWRPLSPISVPWLLAVAGIATAVAEGTTVIWVGAPGGPLQPILAGFLLGLVAGVAGGRKPPRPGAPVKKSSKP